MPKIPAVLLVDDDPTTNSLTKKLLRLGVTDNIRVALNGQQTLHEVRQQRLPGGGIYKHE